MSVVRIRYGSTSRLAERIDLEARALILGRLTGSVAQMLIEMTILVSLITFLACDERPHPRQIPSQQSSLEGAVNDEFESWGEAPRGIFATSHDPHKLFIWQWSDAKIVQRAALDILNGTEYRWLGAGLYAFKGGGVIHLRDLDKPDDISQWTMPWGWYLRWSGQSSNGRYVVFVLDEDAGIRPDGHDFHFYRVRIGLLGPGRENLDWDCVLREEPDAMNIRSAIPSNNGNFVAIGGWNGGVAIADMEAKKLLWAKRPKEEIISYYVVFSDDSKTVYMGGASGYVFGLDTLTGKRISRWCATLSGKAEPGRQVTSIAISSDGRYLAAGSGRLVFVFKTATGDLVAIVDHGTNTYLSSFSPRSDAIATLSGDEIKVWEMNELRSSGSSIQSSRER